MTTFWTAIINGVISMVMALVTNFFPQHQTINLVQRVLDIAGNSLGLSFTIAFSTFNMTAPFLMFSVIMAGEVVRWIYSMWRWFKGLVI